MRSTLPRRRDAVSGFWAQIGRSTLSTAAVSISRTGKWPIFGLA